MNLLQKINSIPEVFSEQIRGNNARHLVMSLYKDGRLSDVEFETILKGFEKTIVNIHGVTIDNSIHIDGDVSQSPIGQAAMDHDLKRSEIFWNRSTK